MNIEKSILLLNEFAKNTKDQNFIEFSTNLFYFVNKNKIEHNINEFATFKELIEKEFVRERKIEELSKTETSYIASSLHLAKEAYNGNIQGGDFYKNFYELHNGFLSQIRIEKTEEENIVDVIPETEQKSLIQTFSNKLFDFVKNANFLKKSKQEIKEFKSSNSKELAIIDDFYEAEEIKEPSVNELLAFIKNKEQIEFPFPAEKTSKKFMKELNLKLMKMGTDEIKSLIAELKAKNEILRQEIESLNSEKENLIKEFNKEILNNENLTNISEIQVEHKSIKGKRR